MGHHRLLGGGDHHATGSASCSVYPPWEGQHSMDPPREATMAGVEVGDDTLEWRTHLVLEMRRGRRLRRSPYYVLELRLRREMGEGTALN